MGPDVQTGHAMWPAVVVDESDVPANRALKPVRLDQSIHVQFFGTHDFARLVCRNNFYTIDFFSLNYNLCFVLRVKLKQAVPFLNGLLSSLHLKCKQASFSRSLEEAKEYVYLTYCTNFNRSSTWIDHWFVLLSSMILFVMTIGLFYSVDFCTHNSFRKLCCSYGNAFNTMVLMPIPARTG
jgi:hypothetical protein